MARALTQPHQTSEDFRFTVEEFEKMYLAGVFPADVRVELLNGRIVQMPPMGEAHFNYLDDLGEELTVKLLGKARVVSQAPIKTRSNYSRPEPDYFAYDRSKHQGGFVVPEVVFFVVEISDSSLEIDRNEKLPLYAAHAIPEVWIINVQVGELEIYRDPNPDTSQYDSKQVVSRGTEAAPLAFPAVTIRWW